MKILTYTSLFPNAVDANQGIFVQNRLLSYIRRYGHELQVVAPIPYFPRWRAFPRWYAFSQVPHCEVRQGVSVYHPRYLVTPKVGMTLYGGHMFLGTLPTVKRLRRTFDFTVIDAHYLYPDAFAAILLGKVFHTPVIVSARGTDVHLFGQLRGLQPLLRFVLRHAAGIITVSQDLKERVLQLGAPADKVHVIGNGVDVSDFYPTDQLAARQRLDLPHQKTLLLSVAKLAEVKGIHHLIEAVALLRQQRPDLLLIIVSNTSDAAYAGRLQAQVAQSQLTEMVRFVGPQPHAALRDWYNACDLFCLGSLREGWPNVLLEALACGKPVVASRVGGVPEVICSSDYGLLVDPPSGSGFAAALGTALQQRWDTTQLVHYARQQSWEQVAAKLQRLFEDVHGH